VCAEPSIEVLEPELFLEAQHLNVEAKRALQIGNAQLCRKGYDMHEMSAGYQMGGQVGYMIDATRKTRTGICLDDANLVNDRRVELWEVFSRYPELSMP
jgi:hypothetical protein